MRILLAVSTLVLAALLAGFVLFLFAGSAEDGDIGPEKSDIAAVKTEFAFTSSEECRECHPDYYDEWSNSWHKKAWTDPTVRASWACYRDQDCKTCHLPEPLMANGKFPQLIPRDDTDIESGINCLTCHISPQGVLGPVGREIEMADHCNPVYHEQIATDQQCWQCHPNQYDDWKTSSYFGKEGCKDCHMEEVERPLVPNGPVRKTRVHFWKGSHIITFIKTAYEYLVEPNGDGVKVTVANTDSGHFFPGERHNRALWVEVTFLDENKQQVGEMEKWVIREGSNLPRNIATMEIKADGKVEKTFPYPIEKGYVKTVLKFDFFYSQEDEHTRVLEDPKPIPFEKK